MKPDLQLARRYLQTQTLPGQLLLCAVTGSHNYGFSSPDSDVDMKGIHLAPLPAILGLGPVGETYDRIEVFEGVECDLTTHEAAKALGLLLRGNGNLLERLTSPFQIVEGEAVEQLSALVPAALSRRAANHYSGYFQGMRAEHGRDRRAKSMLYSYRVVLTGIHLMKTGEVCAHLPTLAERYGFPELHALIELKVSTAEKVALTAAQSETYQERWPELETLLNTARDASPLPEEPPDRAACDRWLVEARLAQR